MSLRKIVLALVLIAAIFLCYSAIANGFKLFGFEIASYAAVEQKNTELESQIDNVKRRRDTDYESKKSALTKAISDYSTSKEKYEALAPALDSIGNEPEEPTVIDLGIKPYDVEYLMVTIGEYATRRGVTIKFDVVKSGAGGQTTTTTSGTGDSNSEYYVMADINFTVSGIYNSIIEFMYDIEDDDELGFEIRDFKMTSGGNGVQGTFSVKNIPINSKNLTELGSSVSTPTTTDGNNTTNGVTFDLDTNAINKNLISDDIKASMNSNTAGTTTEATPAN